MIPNPYKAQPGEDLDQQLSKIYFEPSDKTFTGAFSTEVRWANVLKGKMEADFRKDVLTGHTGTKPPLFFARLETGPSTSIEVVADTYPLAMARLGMVLSSRVV